MTKKHFIELAQLMLRNKQFVRPMAYRIMCEDMADFCARHNSNFDRQKFLAACEHDVDDLEYADHSAMEWSR